MRFSIEAVFKAVDRFTRPIARIQSRMGGFVNTAEKGLLRVNKAIGGAVLRYGKLAAAAGVAAAALGGIMLAANIVEVGSSFEQAIVNVGAVGLQTREQVAALEKKALDLGSTTKFTATEAANAMELMAKAGFKNEEVLAGIDGVLSAAAASGLEMAEVADVVSNVLKGMGLETKEAARVADVLALASARTNSSIGTLGESMKNLSPVARQLNIPLEQAVASVALLQDVGLDASEAGTATATMLTKLTKPIPEVAKRMKELGIQFKDAHGNALPLPGILAQFDKAAKKSGGNMEVVAFFADLVGLRGQKAALNLKEMFASGKMSTLVQELEQAKGVAGQMAELRMDSLQGDWTLLESAVDGVKVALFDMEGGPLRKIVKSTTEWVSANQGLITEKFEGIAKFIGLIADKAPVVIPQLVKWAKFFGAIAAAVGVLIGVLLAMSAVLFATLFAPLVAIMAAWAFFPDFFSGVWDTVKGIAQGFVDFFVGLWEGVRDFFVKWWQFLLGLVVLAWAGIKSVFAPALPYFQAVLDPIQKLWAATFGRIGKRVSEEVAGLKSHFNSLSETMGKVWDRLVEEYELYVAPIVDKIGKFVDKIASIGANADTGGVETLGSGGMSVDTSSASGAILSEWRSVTESRETVDVNINAPPGVAEVKRKKRGSNMTMEQTGTD